MMMMMALLRAQACAENCIVPGRAAPAPAACGPHLRFTCMTPTLAGAGHLGASEAGLDVFEAEPQVPQRLLDLGKVVLTPHIGSATAATRQAMADLAFNNLAARLSGRPVLTPVPECA